MMDHLNGISSRQGGGLSFEPWSPPEQTPHLRNCSSEANRMTAAGGRFGGMSARGQLFYNFPHYQNAERGGVSSGDFVVGQQHLPRAIFQQHQQQLNRPIGTTTAVQRGLVSPTWHVPPFTPSPTSASITASHGLTNFGHLESRSGVTPASSIVDGYAYYLDRGNGELTRLIPADMLPPLNEIPPRELEMRGMVILPPLRASPPKGITEMNHPITIKGGPPQGPRQGPDSLQKKIDHIISKSPKKMKIYCDKWVHEGICAFTQQGCKYKHEMPFDEETQRGLGLFQGLPGWWKKRQEDLKMQSSRAASSSAEQSPKNNTQRRLGMSEGAVSPMRDRQVWQKGKMGTATATATATATTVLGEVISPSGLYNGNSEDRHTQLSKEPVATFDWGPIGPPNKSPSSITPWSSSANSIGNRTYNRGTVVNFGTQGHNKVR